MYSTELRSEKSTRLITCGILVLKILVAIFVLFLFTIRQSTLILGIRLECS